MRTLSGIRLCFLAGTLGNGGAERQLFYSLRALCQAGAAPRLLTLDRGEFWEERIKALGVDVTCVGEQRSRLGRLLRLVKELRKHRPDAVQSQHFFTNAYMAVASWVLGMSGIGAMRNDGNSEVRDSGTLGRLNLYTPRILAANSQIAIRYAIDRGVPASRLYFLPNVVDTEWFKPSETRCQEPLALLAVGRLVKQKRMDRFISTVHRLRTHFGLNVKGLIAGAGRQDELADQARKLGLFSDGLEFLGAMPDMRPVYQRAAICVLTSDHEGTPNVLLEAMACGLPVVATNVGGVPDIVRHGKTGFLCEPENLDRLAGSLAEVVKNRTLRAEMGRRARTFVEANHSLQRLPAYLVHLYQLALPRAQALARTIVPEASI